MSTKVNFTILRGLPWQHMSPGRRRGPYREAMAQSNFYPAASVPCGSQSVTSGEWLAPTGLCADHKLDTLQFHSSWLASTKTLPIQWFSVIIVNFATSTQKCSFACMVLHSLGWFLSMYLPPIISANSSSFNYTNVKLCEMWKVYTGSIFFQLKDVTLKVHI